MSEGDAARLGVVEAARALRAKELSARELVESCLTAIAERNGGEPTFDGAPDAVNAFARIYADEARAAADEADARLAREGAGAPPLCGVPIALKDLYAAAGHPVTGSSRVREDAPAATEDSVAWARLREAGMILVGHTHTHEFAAGGTTDQVGNPWALDRSPGGSSGGSGAALAAGMVPAATGTDTCGSLRIPAALCGISALKPTHGRVPLGGILPLAVTLDHAGPMARSIADCAVLLQAMAEGGAETTPLMPPPAPMGELPTTARPGPRPLEGVRIAVTRRVETVDLEPDVADGYEAARDAVAALGATVVELDDAGWMSGQDLNTILLAEMVAHHVPYADRRDRYRPSIRELLELGGDGVPSEAYLAAQERRAAHTAAWEAWFAEHRVDAILEPSSPIVAPERGHGYDPGHLGGDGDPLIALTATWDLTGFPVAALPAGLGARTGLPVGMSLVAPRGAEAPLVQIAVDVQEHALPPLEIVREPRSAAAR
ncbi:MAG: amidase [Solirubrobacteraceae bacterium]|nr:amidase [Solirubrobacteraceae bacterium]